MAISGPVTVVDVKAPQKRDDPDVRALMEWTKHTVALRGWGFEEWYAAAAHLLANVTFLAGYRRRSVIDEDLIPAVLQTAATGPSVVDLERSLSWAHPALVRPVVLHLLWSGDLVVDMSRPLDWMSVVRPRQPKERRKRPSKRSR